MSEGSVGWDRDPVVAAWPGRPPLSGDVTADACVVGLGATGLAAVEDLAARGLSVVGVDAGRIGGRAAGRNGGFLLAGPVHGLREAVEAWGFDDAVDLHWRTAAELDRLAERLGPGIVRRVGSIRLAGLPGPDRDDAEAADRARELADLATEADLLRGLGVAVEDYDGPLGRGTYLPGNGATNPAVRVLTTAATSPGTLYEHSPVTALRPGLVTCAAGAVHAPVVVVAVDGRLDALLPGLPVRTARLQMLATAPLADPTRVPCPVYGRWGYDYAQQTPDGRLFVGGARDRHEADEWTSEGEPTSAVQADIEQVATRLAGGPVSVADRWAAPVGFTADGRPVAGVVERGAGGGIAACGGYSGTGNLVGPVAARVAVAALLDGAPVPGWATDPVSRGG